MATTIPVFQEPSKIHRNARLSFSRLLLTLYLACGLGSTLVFLARFFGRPLQEQLVEARIALAATTTKQLCSFNERVKSCVTVEPQRATEVSAGVEVTDTSTQTDPQDLIMPTNDGKELHRLPESAQLLLDVTLDKTMTEISDGLSSIGGIVDNMLSNHAPFIDHNFGSQYGKGRRTKDDDAASQVRVEVRSLKGALLNVYVSTCRDILTTVAAFQTQSVKASRTSGEAFV